MKFLFTNLIAILMLVALSLVHVGFVAQYIPPHLGVTINIVLIPFVIGVLSYFALRGPIYLVLVMLTLIPIAQVIYFGGDAAKPGLERLVALMEYAFICIGVLATFVVKRYLSKQQA